MLTQLCQAADESKILEYSSEYSASKKLSAAKKAKWWAPQTLDTLLNFAAKFSFEIQPAWRWFSEFMGYERMGSSCHFETTICLCPSKQMVSHKGFDNKDVLGVNCINELHNTNRIAPPLKFEWFPEEQKTMIKVSYVCEGKVGDYLFQLDNIW